MYNPSKYIVPSITRTSRDYAHSIFNNLKTELMREQYTKAVLPYYHKGLHDIYEKRGLGYADYLDKQSVLNCYVGVRSTNKNRTELYEYFKWV